MNDKVILLAVVGTISMVLSCERLPKPDFSYSSVANPEAGDTIWFSNESSHSKRFEWDFGDGGTSKLENPINIYQEAGIYLIKLTAYNESGNSFNSQSVTIFETTILGLNCYDSTGVNPLSGATIWVYDNIGDRDSLNVPLFSGLTDGKGNVEFRNVDPTVYHIWAIKADNDGEWTFKGFTSTLRQNKVNWFDFSCSWSETSSL